MALGRRAFLAGTTLVACRQAAPRPQVAERREELREGKREESSREEKPREESSREEKPREEKPREESSREEKPRPASRYVLFDAFPALATNVPRFELGAFPSPVERARSMHAWIKRDDDFTRAASFDSARAAPTLFGGGKVRKLELFFGDARARGKTRIVTSGGVGSNQALAVAILGQALGFETRIHLAPQPSSLLTKTNLAADAATRSEMRLFATVTEAHQRALEAAAAEKDTYVVPPGGTTPLGTLGFVNAGLELAEDVRAGRLPVPRRVYVALGLGGTAAGLAIGIALSDLRGRTEVVAVRTSSPATVTTSTLRTIHEETMAFLRARDRSVPRVDAVDVRIEGRFLGGGYGVPTAAGNDAIERARTGEDLALDPVYTGKAYAALLAGDSEGSVFWNTASSRPLARAAVPAAFARWAG